MSSGRLLLVVPMYFAFAATGVAATGQDADAASHPQLFKQLLRTGDVVLLRIVEGAAAYSVQLLTPEQAEEVQTAYAKYNDLRARRDAVKAQLESARKLSERASLFVQQQTLEVDMNKVSTARRLGVYAYEIVYVGEDFVSLKKPTRESFIPLRAIRSIYRTDTLVPTSSSRERVASRASDAKRGQFRLKNTPAAVVVAIIRKTYPDLKEKVKADAATQTVVIEGDSASIRQVYEITRALDAPFPETSPTDEERGQ